MYVYLQTWLAAPDSAGKGVGPTVRSKQLPLVPLPFLPCACIITGHVWVRLWAVRVQSPAVRVAHTHSLPTHHTHPLGQGTLFSAALQGDMVLMTALLHPGEATALRAPSADGASGDGSRAPSYGFSVGDRDEEGNTPLHLAAHSNQACGALGMRGEGEITTRVWEINLKRMPVH